MVPPAIAATVDTPEPAVEEEPEAVPTARPTMEATSTATMDPPGEVEPPAITATDDAPEPAVEEEPETAEPPDKVEPPMIAAPGDAPEPAVEETATPTPAPTPTPPPSPTPDPYTSPASLQLQVIGVEDCLEVRAEPYIESKVLRCIPLGESVKDSTWTIEGFSGVTWRGLGSPIWGFADDRYLSTARFCSPCYRTTLPIQVAQEEFPDVAVLGRPVRWIPDLEIGSSVLPHLDRIYRNSSGDLVRETLVTVGALVTAHPDAFDESFGGGRLLYNRFMVTPDGAHVHVGVCTETIYWGNHCVGTLRLFRSTDGGVTWSYLGSVNAADNEVAIPGVVLGEDPQIVVVVMTGSWTSWYAEVRLFPSGKTRKIDPYQLPFEGKYRTGEWQLIRDGRIVGIEQGDVSVFWTEDGERLGNEIPDHLKIVLPDVQPIPSDQVRHYLFGDNPPEGWPADRYFLETFRSAALIQRGLFLRVTGADDCLPIRSGPSSSSEELACMAERVLLTDLAKASEVDGATWHRVRTPAGIEGWADGRHLE